MLFLARTWIVVVAYGYNSVYNALNYFRIIPKTGILKKIKDMLRFLGCRVQQCSITVSRNGKLCMRKAHYNLLVSEYFLRRFEK